MGQVLTRKTGVALLFVAAQLALAAVGQLSWPILLVNLVLLLLIWFTFAASPRHQSPRAIQDDAGLKFLDYGAQLPSGGRERSPKSMEEMKEAVSQGFDLQLRLLQTGLQLNSAVLVGPAADKDSLRVVAASSDCDLVTEPFVAASGVLGIFAQGRDTISGHPNSLIFNGLPYYEQGRKVGGFFGVILPRQPGDVARYLVVDRDDSSPWQEDEIVLVQAAADKIAIDLSWARQFALLEQDSKATSQVCLALQELNTALGQETAFAAVERAIRDLTGAEFIALTLLQDDSHTVVRASGPGAAKVEGLRIPRQEAGLIEQATTLCHEMPYKFSYQGPAPVFRQDNCLAGFGSLLILPLVREQEHVVGTLVMAGGRPGLFSEERLHILKVIGSQIATKVDLARAHEQINLLATTDSLTGLANRRSLNTGFNLMLQRASRSKTPLAVILCDIDFFKKINDTYGHSFGDEVLQGVARILRDSMRTVDLACRYGGEEFVLILENSDLTGGHLLAERIRQQVAKAVFVCEGKSVSVTMSFGVCSSPSHGTEAPQLIELADQALYRAKEEGRNRTCKAV